MVEGVGYFEAPRRYVPNLFSFFKQFSVAPAAPLIHPEALAEAEFFSPAQQPA